MVVHLLPKPPIGHSPISGKAIQHPAAPIIIIIILIVVIIIIIIIISLSSS